MDKHEKDMVIKTTIYNMVSTLMSEEFYKWMDEEWETIEKISEFEGIMDYYIHGEK